MRAAALGLLVLVAGCGGSTPAAPAPTPAAPPVTAEVTFAVFQAEAPKDVERAIRQQLRTPPAALTAFLDGAGAPPAGLTLTTVPNDDTLPLRREVLVAEAGALGPALESAAVITLVHGLGRPGPRDGLLRWTAAAAALVAEGGGVVVDLDTWKALEGKDFLASLQAADWAEGQIVPSAWQAENGTVGFATRGMARFGLPDVERVGVPREMARLAFGHFQDAITTIRQRGRAQVGDVLPTARLVPCERPREAYTRDCVGLGPP